MRRREFITLLGGAAAAWPFVAPAQQMGEAADHRVPGREHICSGEPMDRRFRAAVARTRLDRGPHRRDPVSLGGGTSRAFRRNRSGVHQTQSGCRCHLCDPGHGRGKAGDIDHPNRVCVRRRPYRQLALVASLARPGGNVTGLSNQATDIAGKRLELLREVVPGLRRLAILVNVGNPHGRAGDGRGSGGGPHVRPRCLPHSKSGEPRISRPPSRRSKVARTRFTSAPIRSDPPTGFNINTLALGARLPTMYGSSGVRRSGRSDILWTKLPGFVPPRRRLCRQDTAWGKAGRSSGRAADQIRSRRQSHHRQGARPHRAADPARARRPGDRVRTECPLLAQSGHRG